MTRWNKKKTTGENDSVYIPSMIHSDMKKYKSFSDILLDERFLKTGIGNLL